MDEYRARLHGRFGPLFGECIKDVAGAVSNKASSLKVTLFWLADSFVVQYSPAEGQYCSAAVFPSTLFTDWIHGGQQIVYDISWIDLTRALDLSDLTDDIELTLIMDGNVELSVRAFDAATMKFETESVIDLLEPLSAPGENRVANLTSMLELQRTTPQLYVRPKTLADLAEQLKQEHDEKDAGLVRVLASPDTALYPLIFSLNSTANASRWQFLREAILADHSGNHLTDVCRACIPSRVFCPMMKTVSTRQNRDWPKHCIVYFNGSELILRSMYDYQNGPHANFVGVVQRATSTNEAETFEAPAESPRVTSPLR